MTSSKECYLRIVADSQGTFREVSPRMIEDEFPHTEKNIFLIIINFLLFIILLV